MDAKVLKPYEERIKNNNDELDRADKLRSQGHICICHKESYPVKIKWCGYTPCKHNKYHRSRKSG